MHFIQILELFFFQSESLSQTTFQDMLLCTVFHYMELCLVLIAYLYLIEAYALVILLDLTVIL